MIVIRCDGCDISTLVPVRSAGDRRVEVETPMHWTSETLDPYGSPGPSEHWCPRCTKRRERPA